MLYRLVNGVGAALFAYAAAVQLNDPDPMQWVALYGLAALFCAMAVVDRTPPFATLTFAVSAGALSYVWSRQPQTQNRMSGFPAWEPLQEETVRETLGLALVAAWMVVLAGWTFARRRSRRRALDQASA